MMLNEAIGQLSYDGIDWKTLVKFVICHWSVSIRLLLVTPGQIGSV